MAYEFKKLSEVELLDSVPAGATVLAEVDGVIRRVPSDGLGGGGGTGVTETDILPEQTIEGFSTGGTQITPSPCELVVGQTYIVRWDGNEYTCVAQDARSAANISAGVAVLLGNGEGLGSLSGNGEPFVMVYIYAEAVESVGQGTEAVLNIEADDTESTSHTVRIYQVSTPSAGVSSWNDLTDRPGGYVESFPEVTYTFDGNLENYEHYAMPEQDGLTGTYIRMGDVVDSARLIGAVMTTVNLNTGDSSEITLTEDMMLDAYGDGSVIGFADGFVAIYTRTITAEETGFGFDLPAGLYFMEMSGQDFSMRTSKLVLPAGECARKWPKELVETPTLPEFDLAAMGLPALPKDGTTVTVACDTSELIAALEQDSVKISFESELSIPSVGTLGDASSSGIPAAMFLNDRWYLSFPAVVYGTLRIFNAIVTTTDITASNITPNNYAHDYVIINSSTIGSTKQFKLTVDDTGAVTATEITTE